MKPNKTEFSEEDIQSTIKYLKTKNPDKATREDAIKLLQKMGDTAHIIAHGVVEKDED